MIEKIEEIQSGLSGLTNENLQELFNMIDAVSTGVSQNPRVGQYQYLYELLDRVYLKVHMIIDEQDHTLIIKYKKAFDKLYHELLERAGSDDDPDETSPTLREMYNLRAYISGIEAALYKGLQRKKYFFSTRGAATTETDYYDPVLEREKGGRQE